MLEQTVEKQQSVQKLDWIFLKTPKPDIYYCREHSWYLA